MSITETAVTGKLSGMTVTLVTDPRTQIPAHRRYAVCQLGGVVQPDGTRTPLKSGVWDRWTDTLVQECGGNPEATREANRLNGIEKRDGFDADLAALLGLV